MSLYGPSLSPNFFIEKNLALLIKFSEENLVGSEDNDDDDDEEEIAAEKAKMEAPKTIAHEIGGVQNDALRFGLNGVKSDIVGSHPLESAYQSVCISSLCLTVWFPRNFSVKSSWKSGPKFGFFAVGVETGSPASVAAVFLGFWTDYVALMMIWLFLLMLTNFSSEKFFLFFFSFNIVYKFDFKSCEIFFNYKFDFLLALDEEDTGGDEEENPHKHIWKCVPVEDGP